MPTPPRPHAAVVAPGSGLSISFTPQLTSGSPGGAPELTTVPTKPQVPKEDVDQKSVGGTKTDKDILARTAQQLRRGVTHKQVASRREFRGCPFHSKPKLVHFKVSPGSSPGAEGTGPGLTRGVRHQPQEGDCPGGLARHTFLVPLEDPGTTRPFAGGPPPAGPQEAASCLRRGSYETMEGVPISQAGMSGAEKHPPENSEQ